MTQIHLNIQEFHKQQSGTEKDVCDRLLDCISNNFSDAENKLWHAHPVWFLDGNPIVGYSVLKDSVRLMFWSGQSFDDDILKDDGTFKAASIHYTSPDQIVLEDIKAWIEKGRKIQWDYKNIVKQKGVLKRLI